jgi:hypothetical protein
VYENGSEGWGGNLMKGWGIDGARARGMGWRGCELERRIRRSGERKGRWWWIGRRRGRDKGEGEEANPVCCESRL